MPNLTKTKLEKILTDHLGLHNPHFLFEKAGLKLSGSIIDNKFAGKGDLQRQKMIWDASDAALGAESVQRVGTILAYTPDEWDIPLVGRSKAKAG